MGREGDNSRNMSIYTARAIRGVRPPKICVFTHREEGAVDYSLGNCPKTVSWRFAGKNGLVMLTINLLSALCYTEIFGCRNKKVGCMINIIASWKDRLWVPR